MIALIISSIIAAATFMFFAGQQRIYDTQTKLLNIQDVSAAMEVLARYTRAAGSGMFECVRPASFANPTSTAGGRLQSTNPSPGPLTLTSSTAPASRPPRLQCRDRRDAIDPAPLDSRQFHHRQRGGQQRRGEHRHHHPRLRHPDLWNRHRRRPGCHRGGYHITITLIANYSSMFRAGELILLLTTPSFGYGRESLFRSGLHHVPNRPQHSQHFPA